jgi:DNA repair protein SbcC/Rad50
MRPLRLEFEGFTAFREPTTVDFEGADLFALTGPTGSGKTSVLDAIVFALYGTIPRLADQRAVAPIIAQGMAEARVRLDFTVGFDEYNATRVVRRTKTGATTAEARLEAAGQVLAGNADEINAKVAELLGLSYEHFTKCVVLPQGDFARFLHDKPKDRQDLLVSLLDLGVYGRMAELAGRRSSDAKSEAAVLEGRLGDLADATPEAVEGWAVRVERLKSLVAELDAAVPELDALNREHSETNAAAERLAAEATRIGAIAIPDGLNELHDRLTTSAAWTAAADAEVQAAEAASASAAAAVAALPDRSDLILLRKAHDEHAALCERRTKSEMVVAERRSDEAASAEALARTEQLLMKERLAADAVAAAHRAHAVRADLVAGKPCPVCLQPVTTVPEEPAPPAVRTTSKRLEKAESAQRRALQDHSAAQQAKSAAEATLEQLADDLAGVEREVSGRPPLAEVIASLDAVDAANAECERTSKAAASARQGLREANRVCDSLADEERQARHRYDATRDGVAALDPPARLGGDAALVDEWRSLADWARAETQARGADSARLVERAETIADRRSQRVAALIERCRAEDVHVPKGADPCGAARQALGQASGDHQRLVDQVAAAEKLRVDLSVVETRRDVARSLATHLDARHFEKWVLDEALTALAEGATEVLATLSGGQYALRVDGRSGGFFVVDHRNAGELRTARTLSGGETFLASLALALALADRIAVLAARGVARLESIFLDEGFGTLDADTLDVVATAIEELGASGRLVGVVSHVADLGERMPVRFEVARSGNASTIERVDR